MIRNAWRCGCAMGTALLFVAMVTPAGEALWLPSVFGDNMVLQRDQTLAVWGRDNPGAEVTVSFADAQVTATADANGRWRLELPAQAASSVNREFTVKGSSTRAFSNVLVGEVWLASGQSNMAINLVQTDDGAAVVAAANHPRIRFFKVRGKLRVLDFPAEDVDVRWIPVAKDNARYLSGVAYYFARDLERELDVPIGIIDSSWGGSRIESWTPVEGFEKVPELKKLAEEARDLLSPEKMRADIDRYVDALKKWPAAAAAARAAGRAIPQPPKPAGLFGKLQSNRPFSGYPSLPRVAYNGNIAPFVPYSIRGAIWYQGEANLKDGALYLHKQKALLEGWRAVWNHPDLAFYFVQLAPYVRASIPGDDDGAELPVFQEAQADFARQTTNTGMAVINDTVANIHDIHPTNKKDVGRRLALLALRGTYGKKDVVASGPTFGGGRTEGDALRVTFDHVGGGLTTRDGKPPREFEIAGSDGKGFRPATAEIEGNDVVLTAAGVTAPTAVRFAWRNAQQPNLMNREGLPAGAFRNGTPPPAVLER